MGIKENAKALGELIKQDAVTVAYNEATEGYKNDPELKNLIFEYNVQQTALREEYGKADHDQSVIDVIEKRSNELYAKITENAAYRAYTTAQEAMNELINSVNREITLAIFGRLPDEECTHDCSSCHSDCASHSHSHKD